MKTTCRQMKATFRKNEAACARVVSLSKLFSSKWRFEIVCLPVRGEFCGNGVSEVVSKDKTSNTSQHSKVLRQFPEAGRR